jgi:hypothetical protein
MLSEELRTAGSLRSTDVTPLRRYCEPLRHPLVVSRFPGAAGYTAYPASALSGRDEEGFSSCSLCPGRRAVANHPAGATRRVNRSATCHAAFALTVAGSASGATHFRGHLSFTVVTARTTRTYPAGRVVEGLQHHRFPSGVPSELRGFRLLPRQVYLLLNTAAFPGRTTVRASWPRTRLKQATNDAGASLTRDPVVAPRSAAGGSTSVPGPGCRTRPSRPPLSASGGAAAAPHR